MKDENVSPHFEKGVKILPSFRNGERNCYTHKYHKNILTGLQEVQYRHNHNPFKIS